MGAISSIFSASSAVVDDCIRTSVHFVAKRFVFAPPSLIEYNTVDEDKKKYIRSKNLNMIEMLICKPNIISSHKILIFAHGNASNNAYMYKYLKYLSEQLEAVVVGFDYQGYGYSQGACSEQNCYDDIQSVVEYFLKQGIKQDNIILIGQSLGTGVVMDFVSKNNWTTAVILISPYESIFRVVVDEDSTLMYTNTLTIYDMFDTQDKTANIRCPIKIFHGENDTVIDITHSKNLFKSLPNKDFQPTWIKNCGHNDILMKIDLNEINEIIY